MVWIIVKFLGESLNRFFSFPPPLYIFISFFLVFIATFFSFSFLSQFPFFVLYIILLSLHENIFSFSTLCNLLFFPLTFIFNFFFFSLTFPSLLVSLTFVRVKNTSLSVLSLNDFLNTIFTQKKTYSGWSICMLGLLTKERKSNIRKVNKLEKKCWSVSKRRKEREKEKSLLCPVGILQWLVLLLLLLLQL